MCYEWHEDNKGLISSVQLHYIEPGCFSPHRLYAQEMPLMGGAWRRHAMQYAQASTLIERVLLTQTRHNDTPSSSPIAASSDSAAFSTAPCTCFRLKIKGVY